MKALRRLALVTGRRLLLGNVLDELSAVHGEKRMYEELPDGAPPRSATYGEAARCVARWAGAVAERAVPGDRVVVALPNGYDFLLACLAVSRAGAIAVPVNPQMRDVEVDHVIADSGASLVVRSVDDLDDSASVRCAPADPGDVAAIFYTSGTTGKPKGASLTHRALVGQVGVAALWPARLRRDEVVVALPVAHIMGFAVLLAAAAAGVPVAFLPQFRADRVLDAIETRRSTIFVGVPAMYRMLLEAGAEERDLRSIRVWGSGADVMPPDLAKRFQRMGASATLPSLDVSIGEALFAEGYGMVETGGAVAGKVAPPLAPAWFGSMILPLPGYRVRVVGDDDGDVRIGEVGELWLKGPGVLRGYHGDPKATGRALSPEGWLHTGDLVRRGPFGLVFFAGRDKDVIKHGGYSVYALEVQTALEEHPDVLEAAAVGLPDERKGEVPAAVVRVRGGAATTGDDLVAWARARLSAYKAPRRVLVVDEIPRTGTQKVRREAVRALFD